MIKNSEKIRSLHNLKTTNKFLLDSISYKIRLLARKDEEDIKKRSILNEVGKLRRKINEKRKSLEILRAEKDLYFYLPESDNIEMLEENLEKRLEDNKEDLNLMSLQIKRE